ncbi:MAG: SPOR domain-containing protein [Sphingomonadales bacterium]|nr:SPOR domain-containing protein [Sphingomonadales bacterium]
MVPATRPVQLAVAPSPPEDIPASGGGNEEAVTPGFSTAAAEPAPEDTSIRDLGLSTSNFSLADLRTELRERAAAELAAQQSAPEPRVDTRAASQPAPPPPPPPATPAQPAREWVQLATGPTQDGLRFTYRQLARENAVFADRDGWYAPYGQTNRLLVGPFENAAEAQQFMNALRAAGSDAFRWRSSAGEDITRLYPEGRSPQPEAGARQPGEAAAQSASNANPARHWVQIGIGRQHDALRFTYRQYARRAPQAFQGKRGWWTSWGQTNRLLVGPFDSAAAARNFRDAIEEEGEIDGLLFTSEAGQTIEPLPGR